MLEKYEITFMTDSGPVFRFISVLYAILELLVENGIKCCNKVD